MLYPSRSKDYYWKKLLKITNRFILEKKQMIENIDIDFEDIINIFFGLVK